MDNPFLKIYQDLKERGKLVSPRGEKVLEIENYSFDLHPFTRFINFVHRKLNINYIKREMLWYLRGDKHDTSITEHAKLWTKMINDYGVINSNYGQYIFYKCKPHNTVSQFDQVVKVLSQDKDSRRAVISILNQQNVLSGDVDLCCTYALNFRIRNDKLNMTVRMRSNDAIYGLGNDIAAFSFIHEMVYISLKMFYPDLELGNYHHSADSFHIYEKHWKMLDDIIKDPSYIDINCPKISNVDEVNFLVGGKFDNIPEGYLFTKWLHEYD